MLWIDLDTVSEPTSPHHASVRAFNLNFGDGDEEATGIIEAGANSQLLTHIAAKVYVSP